MRKGLIRKLYEELLRELGKQNWWPVRKKEISENYDYRVEIVVGAISTQLTKWETVEKKLQNLETFTIDYILSENLEEKLKGIGFLKRKVKTIKELFSYIRERYGNLDEFAKQDVETARRELLKIKGIGKETADAILLYAFDKRTFPVDNYLKRLLKLKYGIEEKNYEKLREWVLEELDSVEDLKEFHALVDVYMKNLKKLSKKERAMMQDSGN